jgi:hypothetical protein
MRFHAAALIPGQLIVQIGRKKLGYVDVLPFADAKHA